jgi:prolyl-tRNA synthetase
MIEPKSYSISEAHALGVAKVAREAEEEGVVLLERNGQKVVMLMSMAPVGLTRFFEMLIRAGQTDQKMIADSDFQEYLSYMVFMLEKKMGLKFEQLSVPEKLVVPKEVKTRKTPSKALTVKK